MVVFVLSGICLLITSATVYSLREDETGNAENRCEFEAGAIGKFLGDEGTAG